MTLSEESSKSSMSIIYLLHLAAIIAASLQRLASSAPLKPGVNEAILLAYYSLVNFGESLRGDK